MTTTPAASGSSQGDPAKRLTGAIQVDDIALAVNAFLMADKSAQDGNENAVKERQQHLKTLQGRYWRTCLGVLSAVMARRKHGLEFTDEERLFLDLGVLDPRMLGGDRAQTSAELLAELNAQGPSGCFYLTEWLNQRHQQLQLESALSGAQEDPEHNYVSQLIESRRRVLGRLSGFLTGLPGIPLEVSESMRTGDLDSAILAAGVAALRDPRRKTLLRRRNLWQLREQVLAKARARANSQGALKLFEMLNEIYLRDWRERYDAFATDILETDQPAPLVADSASVTHSHIDMLMSEAKQMRMRIILLAAIDDRPEPDIILHNRSPRVTKPGLAQFLGVVQIFDRSLAELPPIVITPGSGRGFFAWETGCVTLALRPLVNLEDSVATAFAWQRMLDDRFNMGGKLRKAFESKFPGAIFQHDFPADYRAWLTRLTRGEVNAMNPQRRAFFRDHVGPELSGPLLPPNLRNIGPQTMVAICRRLEKQLAAGDNDLNLHRRLAALYWQQGNMEAAGLQFNAAMQLAPDDGETLFAAGMFMRGRDDNEAAADCFRFGAERAKDSLWGIYCQDALAGQI